MLIIGNGRLITRDAEHPYFEHGAVVCDGGTIVEVGAEAELTKKYPGAEYLDSRGGVIMPGPHKRAHTHLLRPCARPFDKGQRADELPRGAGGHLVEHRQASRHRVHEGERLLHRCGQPQDGA